jgi:hypothetical protein
VDKIITVHVRRLPRDKSVDEVVSGKAGIKGRGPWWDYHAACAIYNACGLEK